MYKFAIIFIITLISCKKQEITPVEPTTPQSIQTEVVTYKCYGNHYSYQINYVNDKGESIQLPFNTSNGNWNKTFTDTTNQWRRIEYRSTVDVGTMTAIIQINGITMDSITLVGGSKIITINR